MSLKSNGTDWSIKEQIVKDEVTGLTLEFAIVPESEAPIRLRVYNADQSCSRELLFNEHGEDAGAGCHLEESR